MRPLLVLVALVPMLASAEEPSADQLARDSQNPLSELVRIPLIGAVEFGIGPFNRVGARGRVEPILPVALVPSMNVVTRFSVPYLYEPEEFAPEGGTTGFGDATATVFLSPRHAGRLSLGAGPMFLLPLGSAELGARKWAVGPAAVAFFEGREWTLGLLVDAVFSFAGPGPDDVALVTLEYKIARYFGDGWFVGTRPLVTADLTVDSSERWLVPFGVGIGRVLTGPLLAVEFEAGAYVNVVRPETEPAALWSVEARVTLLLHQWKPAERPE